ncbi:MAG: nuclear transport factor 2 family protein [Mycobacterium sp.]|uniref:nuclear transport factor 2 family protein n=1 Tax=Mycobacterium sp. TaxID=1785 RepID=UPI003BB51727
MPTGALTSITPTQQVDYARWSVSATHPFRKAVEEHDEQAIAALLADDVVFTSPVAFKPYVGKPITAAILRGVLRVFVDFRYIREINDSDGHEHAFEFEAGIAGAPGVTVNGCDFLHINDDGLIDDFKVMVRPLSGATALSEAMAAQFPRIQQEALELAGQFAKA